MDLLKYLIAPHEQRQQPQHQPATSVSPAPAQGYLRRNTAGNSGASIASVQDYHAQVGYAAHADQHQPPVSGGIAPDRAKLLQALAGSPSVLNVLLQQELVTAEEMASVGGSGTAVSVPASQITRDPRVVQAAVHGSLPQAVSGALGAVSQAFSQQRDGGSMPLMSRQEVVQDKFVPREEPGSRAEAVQTVVAHPPERLRYASHGASEGPKFRALCFFWYHYGDCNKHPQSPNFVGQNAPCRFLHYLDAGMENVPVQKVPWHLHKPLGDCGLERCPWSSTFVLHPGRYNLMGKGAHPSQTVPPDSTPRQPLSERKGKSKSGGKSEHSSASYMPPTPTSTAAASPTEDKKKKKKKKKKTKSERKAAKKARELAAAAEQSPAEPAIPSAKRKASELSSSPTEATKSVSKPKHKKQKKAPTKPITKPPRYFDIIEATAPEPSAGTMATKNKQTCFFWYHGSCSRTGKNCEMMHALTDPPSFVQPPPDYVHRDKCFRAWCPGDFMWDHTNAPEVRVKEEKKKLGDEDLEEGTEPEYDEVEEGEEPDDEWCVQGFPDA